ncbi:acidic repeat-containing protein-like [Lytechinus variegatus]|uniref:acidic repeat-containing protein-like n=1 Tax=Lytechinus variegatus TaxID=7654 RepID=UPI001BB18A61|nr:acidic repeat-containing protein-like [Lytechinus variegatus]
MSTNQSPTQPAVTTSSTNMDGSSVNTGAIIGAVVAVVVAIVVVGLVVYFWCYFKRKKQSHSFPESHPIGDQAPTFRVLSTWEEAITNQEKQKDAPEYTPVQMDYSTPDLIAGTNDSEVIQNNQYERLRNTKITSETSKMPTIAEDVNERPLSVGFDNPGFDIGLDEIFETPLFNGPIKLGRELSREEESDNERNLSQSPTDLGQNFSIIATDPPDDPPYDPPDETTIESHNKEDDRVSTKESESSDDVNVDTEDVSEKTEEVNDTNSEDIDDSHDNPGFEMEEDINATSTSPESPTEFDTENDIDATDMPSESPASSSDVDNHDNCT